MGHHSSPVHVRLVRSVSQATIECIIWVLRATRVVDWQLAGPCTAPPPTERIIFVSNHLDWHDIPLLFWAIPRTYQLWWFAKAELLAHWMGWWFRQLPMIPVHRGTGDAVAVERAIDVVRQGKPLVIFPEGTWDDGQLLKAKTGTVRIACATDAWIVPMGMTGTQQQWRASRRVTFGTAFRVRELPSYNPLCSCDNQSLTALTSDIMQRIAALLPPSYHGFYRLPLAGK